MTRQQEPPARTATSADLARQLAQVTDTAIAWALETQ